MTCKHGYEWCMGEQWERPHARPCSACIEEWRAEIERLGFVAHMALVGQENGDRAVAKMEDEWTRLYTVLRNININTADSSSLNLDQARWKLGVIHSMTSAVVVDDTL